MTLHDSLISIEPHYLSVLHDSLLFPRTPFNFKDVTPRCLAPPFPARSLKFMRRWRRQDQRDVKTIARIYHAFILGCQYSFHFFPTLLFALSSFGFITNFYSLPIFLSFIFLSSCCFNGGKVSDLHSAPRSQNFSVLHSRHILVLSEPHYLLLLHDVLIAAESSCFCACGKIVYFYRAALFPRLRHDSLFPPKCHRSARHDSFFFAELHSFKSTMGSLIFAEMPSFKFTTIV